MRNNYIVFSDVDETLIHPKSMIAFMDDAFAQARPRSTARMMRDKYSAIKAAHSPTSDRATLNRRYYGMFEGILRDNLQRAARSWTLRRMAAGDLFIDSTYEELLNHRRQGAELVLVSGSFPELLDPIRAHLEADALLCTELEAVGGVFTGRVLQQVIGEGKWDVICRYLRGRTDVRLEDCVAYGDHISDVSFMEKVGHAVVVGDAPAMLQLALERNWRVLPACPRVT